MEWATREAMQPSKSSFVTVVAWIFIALDGMGGLILLVQNAAINTIVPLDQLRDGMAKAASMGRIPPAFAWVFDHIRPVLLVLLLVTLIRLVADIGLLNRRNWARLVFIAILALGIAWGLAGIVIQHFVVSSVFEIPRTPGMPPDFEATLHGMMIGMRVFSAVFALGFAVLYAWMIRKLMSPGIAAEFTRRGH
jgi:hypothetical protein